MLNLTKPVSEADKRRIRMATNTRCTHLTSYLKKTEDNLETNQNSHQPYLEAIKQVLDGNPVKNLDDIRRQCNEAYLKTISSKTPGHTVNYSPDNIIVSFIADAENKILLGANPIEIYNGFHGTQSDFRQGRRKILEDTVRNYLE